MNFKEIFSGWFLVWAIFCLTVSLAVLGLFFWAVITLVNKA